MAKFKVPQRMNVEVPYDEELALRKLHEAFDTTYTESQFLLLLARSYYPVSRDSFVLRLGLANNINSVSVHVYNLREKVDIPIESVRGFGYRLTDAGRHKVREVTGPLPYLSMTK